MNRLKHIILTKLYDRLRSIMDMKASFPHLTQQVFECAQKLQLKDSYLEDTDSLILAHALIDPDSDRLITSDQILIDSTAITEFEQDMRDGGQRNTELRIVDSLN